MSGGPLDVSLRVRMRYEAGDTARRAVSDVEAINAKARQLGATSAGDKLARDLRAVSGQAQTTGRDLAQVSQTAMRLGAGDGTTKLATGLKDAWPAPIWWPRFEVSASSVV